MGERKLLEKRKLTMKPKPPTGQKKSGGFWSKILDAADAASHQQSTRQKVY